MRRSPSKPAKRTARAPGKANLDYGDCFSYALAKATGLPLLFKGHDFSHTDVAAVLQQSEM